jgi:alkylation response protein AidB-like acyl-CoA dehydrogenase
MPQTVLTCCRLQEVFGGNAVSDEYGIGRHVANLFVTQTYEGQSDIHGEFPLRAGYLDAG